MFVSNNITYDTRYKGDNGRWLVTELFYEFNDRPGKERAIYTFNKYREGFKIFIEEYLKLNDPTEYKVANEMFGGWPHWEEISNSTKLKPYIEQARKELELKLKSEALQLVIADAGSSTQTAASSRKYLLDSLYKTERKSQTTKSKAQTTAMEVFELDQIKHDLKRLEIN